MPSIENEVRQIQTAIYGEEVRGSIVDALVKMNNNIDASSQENLRKSVIGSEWSSSTNYKKDDYVWYPSFENGLLYRAKQDNSNKTPNPLVEETAYWKKVTLIDEQKRNADDIIKVQNTQPTEKINKIWIKDRESEVSVPTWDEFTESETATPRRYVSPPAGVTSCDDVAKNSWYFNSVNGSLSTFTDFPFNAPGFLQTIVFDRQMYQMAVNWSTNAVKHRIKRHGTWGSWTDVAVGDGINDKIGLIDRVLASNSLGIDVNERRETLVNGGITCEWDESRHMYHIYGRAGSNNALINIYDRSVTLPDGMKPGKVYCWYASAEGIYEPQDDAAVDIYINKSSPVNWTLLQNWSVNGRINFASIPSDAIGLLVRYRVLANKTVDFYSKVTISNDVWSMPEFANHSALLTLEESYGYGSRFYPESKSCDDIKINSVMFNSYSAQQATFTDFPFNAPGWIWTYHIQSNHDAQFAMSWSTGAIKYRVAHAGEWQEWMNIGGQGEVLPDGDLDTVLHENCFYLLASPHVYANAPLNTQYGFLDVQSVGMWTHQFFYELTGSRVWKRSFMNDTKRMEWTLISGGGGGPTYNITQEINRDEISNTYNITTSPTITTDTNDYIQAIDNESTSEASATDMTGAIMSMLNSTGHCKLGPGVFYVSGSIDMPNGSMLEGCGNKTIVRLLSSVSSGYIVKIKQYNTIKDIHFSGGTSTPANLYTDGTNMGSRHGVYMVANADGQESGPSGTTTTQCVITNCWFDNFDGSAFYAHNTGGGIHNSVIFSDSHIEHCRVGLNIDYYNEYAKYSHLVIFQCYYACINNGGNNIFTGCTFHGVVGWLTDNSNNDKRNNQHGSCIGCTFNHIDNMNHPDVLGNGKAVHIINGSAGFIFTGCQLWYGNVYIENSQGVQFSDCLFGNNGIEIEVTGSYPAFFFNNIFWTQPTLDVISGTKFEGNYLKTGSTVAP